MFAPLKNQKGFTLIELVIIIIMIGMLAAIAVPRYVDLKDKALAAGAKGTLDGGRAAITLDFADEVVNNGSYPNPLLSITAAGSAVTDATDLSGLHAEMQGIPNYPPTGLYNIVAGEGFRWWVVTAGSSSPATPPVIDAIIDTTCDAADSQSGGANVDCWVSKL